MKETWVQSLGWKDPLEEGMVTHSSIVAWRIPMDRGAWQATVHGVIIVRHDLATKLLLLYLKYQRLLRNKVEQSLVNVTYRMAKYLSCEILKRISEERKKKDISEMVLVTASYIILCEPLPIVLQTLSSRFNSLNLFITSTV